MNKTTKEMISDYLADSTKKFDLVNGDPLTTVAISDSLHISRTVASQYLNELCEEGKVFKVKSRPVYFFSMEVLKKKYGLDVRDCEFVDLQEMIEYLQQKGQQMDVFHDLIGYDGSLRRMIKRCSEVFNYPPYGLTLVIYGNEGTGKRTLADLLCKHSLIRKGIVTKDTRIIKRDLSVNDPFLTDKIEAYIDEHCKESHVIILSHFEEINEKLTSYLIRFFEKSLNSKIHFIFLSEKRPDDFLPSSLAKYVPVAVHMRDFHERPKEEREGIIRELFRREEINLNVHIFISSNVLRVLVNCRQESSIEDLSKKVKLMCAQAINEQNSDEIRIHTAYLPEELVEAIELSTDNVAYIDCEAEAEIHRNDGYLEFLDGVLDACQGSDSSKILEKYRAVYEMVCESILSSSKNEQTLRGTEAALGKIINWVASKHFINIPGNFNFILATLLSICNEQGTRFEKWASDRKGKIEEAENRIERLFVTEAIITDEICSLSLLNLEEEIPIIFRIVMSLAVASYNADLNKNATFGVIICHGYSTATSIAGAVNTLIGSYIFDSIDMPVMTTVDEIKATLREKLSRINSHADICIMVDMGSLEKLIDEDLTRNRNIAIVNNVTTKMALDIGYKIRNGVPIDQFFANFEEDYKIEHALYIGKKKDVILFTSESGFQTAQRMAKLFADSFPVEIPVELRPVMFDSLNEEIGDLTQKYNVLFVTGTDNPGNLNVTYIPLEDIVTTTNLDLVSSKLNGYMDEENLRQLIINIRSNFSLMNVLNYLTILNPKPLMDATTMAIDDLQKRRGVELEGRTLVGIYIHVCILVERLVTKNGVIRNDSATGEFVKDHQDFIKDIRSSFKSIEKHYNITIPDSEMKYIYSFIYRED